MKIAKEVEIEVTPKEMAEVFADWHDDEQALFFTELANCIERWDDTFSFQCNGISECEELTSAGRNIMRIIGEYS